MVLLEDGSKTNIGLSLKFESKGLKVLGWTKRNDRGWEFSETAVRALEKYKVSLKGVTLLTVRPLSPSHSIVSTPEAEVSELSWESEHG